MTIDEMLRLKKQYGYSYAMIAEETGIPLSTLQKVFSKQTKSPRYETMSMLHEFFCKNVYDKLAKDPNRKRYELKDRVEKMTDQVEEPADRVEESAGAYGISEKQQGEYTLEDYYAMPEDQRVELIDGNIYYMDAPTWIHQDIVEEIFFQISSYIRKNKGGCIVKTSPVDVQLDQDDKTMVQPDLLITCKKDLITRRCLYGAPDWAMEVLSPSTSSKDSIIKLNKYFNAGVREYWVVDPEKKSVTVYDFEHDNMNMHYTFDDQIPIAIYDGDFKIDMSVMNEMVDMFGEDDRLKPEYL